MKTAILSIPLVVAIIAAIASAGDRVPLAVTGGRIVQTGSGDTLVVDQVRTSLVQAGVLATDGARLDNWHPTGLGTKSTYQIQAGDNHGNWVTGIDAIGAALPLGTRITICNANSPQDDGAVGFSAEDANSLANNRIWNPGYARNSAQTNTHRYILGQTTCADFVYVQPDQSDPTTKRWLIVSGAARIGNSAVKQFGLFPYSVPAAITSGSSVNDYNAPDTCPIVGGPIAGSCEAGGDPALTSYSVVMLSTTGAGSATVTGMKYAPNGSQNVEGQGPVKYVLNVGPGNLVLTNNDGSSAALNQWQISLSGNAANVVLTQNRGMMFWHQRDTGGWIPMSKGDYLFDARDVTMTSGLQVSGVDASVGVAGTTLMIDQQLAGRALSAQNIYSRDTGSYDTTAAGRSAYGAIIAQDATRSVGGNTLTNVALLLDSNNGQTNYALQTTGGNIYLGLGAAMTQPAYINGPRMDVSGAVNAETTLFVGGGDFTTNTRTAIAQASVAPTANHGTLDASSSNFVGRVTSVGAFTAVTVTFSGGFGTTAFCEAQIEGSAQGVYVTPSATAPVFNCFNTSTLAAANCNNFSYNCWGH